MERTRSFPWLWYVVWAVGLLGGAALSLLFAALPADSAWANLDGADAESRLVRRPMEVPAFGMKAGSVTVNAGVHTATAVLADAHPGPEWHIDGSMVIVAMLGQALAIVPLRRRAQGLIDQVFRRSKSDYQLLQPEMSEKLATSVDPNELVALLTKELPQRLQIDWSTLAVFDSTRKQFSLAGDSNHHPPVPISHPLATHLRWLGQPLLRLQTAPQLPSQVRAFLDQFGIELSIPLIVGDKHVAIWNLGPKRAGGAFSVHEVRLLRLVGQQAAVSLENNRLIQAEREQRMLAEALQEAAKVVSSTLDLDQVLDRILQQVERVVDGDAFNIMLAENGVARIVRWRGYERRGVGCRIASLSMCVAQHVTLTQMVQTGKPILVPDTGNEPNWVPSEGWEWLRSYVAAPIIVSGQTAGFLNVDGTQLHQFSLSDARRLEAFAHHAATALENAWLYAETQKQLREQTALRKAGAVISSTLERKDVLTRIAEQMGQAIDATSAYINSYEPTKNVAGVLAEYYGPGACNFERVSDIGAEYPEDAEVEWLGMMQAGQHDVSHIDDPGLSVFERAHMEEYGAKTILYIPLRIKGELIGYAELWESRRRREFTAEEIALCHDIAQQAAVALEHARLYEQAQQEIAERKRAEQQIKTSLEEKDVLLQEIHHRVKNNLQVVSSLLHLQSRTAGDERTRDLFRESQSRVKSMALMHETLYQSSNAARVDIANYVHSLASYLLLSYGVNSDRVNLCINVEDVALSIDTAIPCGLILNELISNSLKHAFPDGRKGQVDVEFRCDGAGGFVVVVKDDGLGIPADADPKEAESLGLQLVFELVNQLEGSIELDRIGGTAFRINFPDELWGKE